MRKTILSLTALITLCLAAVYVFIPSQIVIKGSKMVYQPTTSVIRGIMQTNRWPEWMPKDIEIKVIGSLVATIQAEINVDQIQVPIVFSIKEGQNKSSTIDFETNMDNGQLSPIARIQYFIFAKKIQNKLDRVIEAASNYYNYSKGIYGFDMVETKVKDSSYLAIDQTLADTPSIDKVYEMVHHLEQYIIQKNGRAKGAPMVNITRVDEVNVYTQVAIPLERDIQVEGAFSIKKMVLGNLLSVSVEGDQSKVNLALEATKQYITDKQKYSPAIPFVIYNTNRQLEKDSSRWKSTINYPIF